MLQAKGAVVIGFGKKAQAEALKCKAAWFEHHTVPLSLFDQPAPGMTNAQASRWAKVNLDNLSPYDQTLYLDADTRAQADLSAGFDMLDDGFDLVISPSPNQGEDCLWHIEEPERQRTIDDLGYLPLQLQAGLFFFRKSPEMLAFFEAWREEWELYRNQDQAAFLRALKHCPLKIWLLGRPWNGGALVQHKFGACRK